jgi:phosphoribosylformylglycinamidine cyclo-ligase
MQKKDNATYKQAGVDIEAGNKLVEIIKPLAASTRRPGVFDSIGGFGALFDIKKLGYHDPLLVSGTDGVGTKLKVALEAGLHNTIGIDLVAMCVNDIIVQGAEPLFFLDYFATGKLNLEIAASVIEGIAAGCKEASCALIGGETAEMPGMYQASDYDLAGFCVGIVERNNLLPKKNEIKIGDYVIGIASSGLHSNGYSLARYILENNNLNYKDEAPFAPGKSFAEALLTPTKIYVASCLTTLRNSKVKALAHITGGGLLENIPRILPSELSVKLNLEAWEVPEIFKWLKITGKVDLQELMRTFNYGIGMVIITDEPNKVLNILAEQGEQAWLIGAVESRIHNSVTF